MSNLSEKLETEQESVILSPLPAVDLFGLCVRYARYMGDNKIRHYALPYTAAMIAQFSGRTPEDLVSDYIKENEGIQNVTFTGHIPIVKVERGSSPLTLGKALQPFEVKDIFKDEKDIEKALLKRKSVSLLYQFIDYKTFFDKLKDKIGYRYNQFVYWANQRLHSWFFPLYEYKYLRKLYPVRYLTVCFEEPDKAQGTEAFLEDLRLLQKNELIFGHLMMPHTMDLADGVGSGLKPQVLFCFLLVNEDKLQKILNKSPLEMSHFPLTELGLKYETLEGNVKWLNDITPEQKYQLEVIEVSHGGDAARQEYIKNYKANVPFVNEVAAKQAEALRELGKMERVSHTHEKFEELSGCQECGQGRKGLVQEVHVKVDFKKKEDK